MRKKSQRQPNMVRGLLNWAKERPAHTFAPWANRPERLRQYESDVQARNTARLMGGISDLFLDGEGEKSTQAYYPFIQPLYRGLSWLNLDPYKNVSSNIRKSLWSSYPGRPNPGYANVIERDLINRTLTPEGYHTPYSQGYDVPELTRLMRANAESGMGVPNPDTLSQLAGATAALEERFGGDITTNYKRLEKMLGGKKNMRKYFNPRNLENLVRMSQLGI